MTSLAYGNYTGTVSLNNYSAAVTNAAGNLVSARPSAAGQVLISGDPITGPEPRFGPAGSFLPAGINLIYGTDGAGTITGYDVTGTGSTVVLSIGPIINNCALTGTTHITALVCPTFPDNSVVVTPPTFGPLTTVGPGTGGVFFQTGSSAPAFSQGPTLSGTFTAAVFASTSTADASSSTAGGGISVPGGGVSVGKTLWAHDVKADTSVSAPTLNATTQLNTPNLTLASFISTTNSIPYSLVTGVLQALPIGTANKVLVSAGTNSPPAFSSTLAGLTLTAPAIASASFTGTLSGSASWSAGALSTDSPVISGTVTGGATYNSVTLSGTVGGSATYTSPTLTNQVKISGLPAKTSVSFPAQGFLAIDGSNNVVNYDTTGTGKVVQDTGATIATPTITSPSITGTVGGSASYTSPSITGTVGGGASYTAPTLTSPSITGTVGGSASYTTPTLTSPSITGTVGGSASYTSPTLTNPVTLTGLPVKATTGFPSQGFLAVDASNTVVNYGTEGTGKVVQANNATIVTPIIQSPSITGTVGGGATYTSPILTTPGISSPTITGTVLGGATYTSPTLTTPSLGVASATSLTMSASNSLVLSAIGPNENLITGAGGAVKSIPIGTNGYVMTAKGTGSDPQYNPFDLSGGIQFLQGILPVSLGGTGSTTVAAHTVFSGSSTSGTVAPSFRALVTADLPAIPLSTGVSGVLPIANGGTGAPTTSQNLVFAGPSSGSGAPLFRSLTTGDLPTSFPIRLDFGSTGGSPVGYTMPATCKYIVVELVGSGGNGGVAGSFPGGGGGAGGFVSFLLRNIGNSYVYQSGQAQTSFFGTGLTPPDFAFFAVFGTNASGVTPGIGGGFGVSGTLPAPANYSNIYGYEGGNGSTYIAPGSIIGGAGAPGIFGGWSGSTLIANANGQAGRAYTGSGGGGGNISGGSGGLGGVGAVTVIEYYV